MFALALVSCAALAATTATRVDAATSPLLQQAHHRRHLPPPTPSPSGTPAPTAEATPAPTGQGAPTDGGMDPAPSADPAPTLGTTATAAPQPSAAPVPAVPAPTGPAAAAAPASRASGGGSASASRQPVRAAADPSPFAPLSQSHAAAGGLGLAGVRIPPIEPLSPVAGLTFGDGLEPGPALLLADLGCLVGLAIVVRRRWSSPP